ncbi:unnamed protein product [Lactuca virosa]|uniref:Uncharacterized protein n=1 Tax=Lactuca virosa TaxID=75947 RepID=A0AAU9PBA2_9ASTR|nr:unnamed protein product [Lactuca virosa]
MSGGDGEIGFLEFTYNININTINDELKKTWLCKRCETMSPKLSPTLHKIRKYLVEATEEASLAYSKAVTRLQEYQVWLELKRVFVLVLHKNSVNAGNHESYTRIAIPPPSCPISEPPPASVHTPQPATSPQYGTATLTQIYNLIIVRTALCWDYLSTTALNAIRYWVDLKNALKSSGKLHGDVDPSSVKEDDMYDHITEESASIRLRLAYLSAEEEILRPALERDLARNKKLESFKLIELRNRDRHNTIKINLRDQSEENAICLIDIHLWIAFNLRTLHKITIISGNTNHQAIGRYLLRKYVRLKENPGVFEITFFLNKKDYNFDNEMDWVGDQTNSWRSVLEALLRCGQLYVGVNQQGL